MPARQYSLAQKAAAYASSKAWAKEHPEETRISRGRYRASLKGRFALLHSAAKRSNRELSLSFKEYCTVVSSSCYYCGGVLPETGTGIDRINSDIGYVLGNCRPCCTDCNIAKNNMTENEFKEWVLRVLNNWIGR